VSLVTGSLLRLLNKETITRARDQENQEVQVEDADGGIGSGPAVSSQVTYGSSANGLIVSASMSN